MPEQEPDIRAIFCKALECKSKDLQIEYLDQACCGDSALRQRVDSLIQTHHRAGSFFRSEEPVAPTIDQPPIAEKPDTYIGPYKLAKQIGEGGMGTVFMALQKKPVRRTVALKVIKPGMDSMQVVSRFES